MNCANCDRPVDETALLDDRTDKHFCDGGCLYDWITDNLDEVVTWYKRMNVGD
jgi:hypothetical protein